MKILTNVQIKELDKYTIEEQQITSIELMERAATVLSEAIGQMFQEPRNFRIFAGPGNNGGDALAVARMLAEKGHQIEAFLFNTKGKLSPDCEANAERLIECENVSFVEVTSHFCPPQLRKSDVVIDGLFGSGVNKPLEGGFAAVVRYINASPATVISIDMPSGLMCEDNTYNVSEHIVRADMTLTLQMPKLAFLLPENAPYVGEWYCLDIALSSSGISQAVSDYSITTCKDITQLIKPREEFAHKGNYGHALLIAGSEGMAGASVLAARACLRSGVGLLTVHAPSCNRQVLQTAVPEAMVHVDAHESCFSAAVEAFRYQAVAIGPGIGTSKESADALLQQLRQVSAPMILDADALNILANHKILLPLLPPGTILTPHPGELDRLVGRSSNGYERLMRAREFAASYRVCIVLKGAWTVVVTPDGRCRFNPTGNPGMATAGSGDVLTGVLLALLARGYEPVDAAVSAVYLHGAAGDYAAEKMGENGLIASDIVDYLPLAWNKLEKNQYLCSNKEQKCC